MVQSNKQNLKIDKIPKPSKLDNLSLEQLLEIPGAKEKRLVRSSASRLAKRSTKRSLVLSRQKYVCKINNARRKDRRREWRIRSVRRTAATSLIIALRRAPRAQRYLAVGANRKTVRHVLRQHRRTRPRTAAVLLKFARKSRRINRKLNYYRRLHVRFYRRNLTSVTGVAWLCAVRSSSRYAPRLGVARRTQLRQVIQGRRYLLRPHHALVHRHRRRFATFTPGLLKTHASWRYLQQLFRSTHIRKRSRSWRLRAPHCRLLRRNRAKPLNKRRRRLVQQARQRKVSRRRARVFRLIQKVSSARNVRRCQALQRRLFSRKHRAAQAQRRVRRDAVCTVLWLVAERKKAEKNKKTAEQAAKKADATGAEKLPQSTPEVPAEEDDDIIIPESWVDKHKRITSEVRVLLRTKKRRKYRLAAKSRNDSAREAILRARIAGRLRRARKVKRTLARTQRRKLSRKPRRKVKRAQKLKRTARRSRSPRRTVRRKPRLQRVLRRGVARVFACAKTLSRRAPARRVLRARLQRLWRMYAYRRGVRRRSQARDLPSRLRRQRARYVLGAMLHRDRLWHYGSRLHTVRTSRPYQPYYPYQVYQPRKCWPRIPARDESPHARAVVAPKTVPLHLGVLFSRLTHAFLAARQARAWQRLRQKVRRSRTKRRQRTLRPKNWHSARARAWIRAYTQSSGYVSVASKLAASVQPVALPQLPTVDSQRREHLFRLVRAGIRSRLGTHRQRRQRLRRRQSRIRSRQRKWPLHSRNRRFVVSRRRRRRVRWVRVWRKRRSRLKNYSRKPKYRLRLRYTLTRKLPRYQRRALLRWKLRCRRARARREAFFSRARRRLSSQRGRLTASRRKIKLRVRRRKRLPRRFLKKRRLSALRSRLRKKKSKLKYRARHRRRKVRRRRSIRRTRKYRRRKLRRRLRRPRRKNKRRKRLINRWARTRPRRRFRVAGRLRRRHTRCAIRRVRLRRFIRRLRLRRKRLKLKPASQRHRQERLRLLRRRQYRRLRRSQLRLRLRLRRRRRYKRRIRRKSVRRWRRWRRAPRFFRNVGSRSFARRLYVKYPHAFLHGSVFTSRRRTMRVARWGRYRALRRIRLRHAVMPRTTHVIRYLRRVRTRRARQLLKYLKSAQQRPRRLRAWRKAVRLFSRPARRAARNYARNRGLTGREILRNPHKPEYMLRKKWWRRPHWEGQRAARMRLLQLVARRCTKVGRWIGRRLHEKCSSVSNQAHLFTQRQTTSYYLRKYRKISLSTPNYRDKPKMLLRPRFRRLRAAKWRKYRKSRRPPAALRAVPTRHRRLAAFTSLTVQRNAGARAHTGRAIRPVALLASGVAPSYDLQILSAQPASSHSPSFDLSAARDSVRYRTYYALKKTRQYRLARLACRPLLRVYAARARATLRARAARYTDVINFFRSTRARVLRASRKSPRRLRGGGLQVLQQQRRIFRWRQQFRRPPRHRRHRRPRRYKRARISWRAVYVTRAMRLTRAVRVQHAHDDTLDRDLAKLIAQLSGDGVHP